MIKTILVPVDFTINSLNTLKFALESQHERTEIILMYAELQSDSITDLLFYSQDKIIGARITSDFILALEAIKNRFEKNIEDIVIKVFHGTNANALNSFLVVNCIDEIFIPKTYKLSAPRLAFDPIPILKKAPFPVHEIEWKAENALHEKNQLDSLFNWAKQ